MSQWVEDSHLLLVDSYQICCFRVSDKDGKLGDNSDIFMAYRERQHGPESCGLEMRFLVS